MPVLTARSATERAIRALERWPKDRPLAALVSGPGSGPWARRSILAAPAEVRTIRPARGLSPAEARTAILAELRSILAPTLRNPGGSSETGWILSLSYDLGRFLEPAASIPDGARDDRDWPVAMLLRCPGSLVLDHASGHWSTAGDRTLLPFGPEELEKDDGSTASPADTPPSIGPLELVPDRADFERTVAECVERIHRGDLFQANIARRLSASFEGSMRSLATRALRGSGAWFGAYLECGDGRGVISMSPELFLAYESSSRRIRTRPIKGTVPEGELPARLEESGKDAAELAMIVDLMRNDLGRVASIGSVRVDEPRALECHPTVWHAVADVSATLRVGLDALDLLVATFPPGSVTGAPKVQAMRTIDELEPFRRGPYCGAIGLLSGDGSLRLNVAIRTIALSGRGDPRRPGECAGLLDYWTGCGIVAESRPEREWAESVAKAEVLRRALGRGR